MMILTDLVFRVVYLVIDKKIRTQPQNIGLINEITLSALSSFKLIMKLIFKTQLTTLLICLTYSLSGHSQAFKRACTLVNTSSLVIQQVDEDWNPIPFDCANIEVTIESDDFKKTIMPGKYQYCSYGRYKNTDQKKLMVKPIPVLFESPGTYQVNVKRFDEISIFSHVVIPLDESGCHTISQLIEVQFDMTKKSPQ